MINLRFKIITYEYTTEQIKKNIKYYTNSYECKMKLGDILNGLIGKFYVDTYNHFAYIRSLELKLWGNYFKNLNSNSTFCDEREVSDYYKYKIGDLCNQFHINKGIIEVWIDPPIGGSVGCCRGIHFFFHTNEKDLHHIPHIHVKQGEVEFRVNLLTLTIIDQKTFKNTSKTKLALNLIEKNQEDLINYWNKVVVEGESIKFKMFCPV